MEEKTSFLFVTANVGSIFEDVSIFICNRNMYHSRRRSAFASFVETMKNLLID